MPRKPNLATLLERLRPPKSVVQIPTGWWKDAKHRSQPPGSYLDPSLRLDKDGSPVAGPKAPG